MSEALLPALNLPAYPMRQQVGPDGKPVIWDPIRKKYVRRTPEEWVRQHLVQYLVQELGVPIGLVTIEHSFTFQKMPRRADVIVHRRDASPVLMVECKAPEVVVQQAAFDQVARYNTVVRAPYLLVSNGLVHYCCRIHHEQHRYEFLDALPPYAEMIKPLVFL